MSIVKVNAASVVTEDHPNLGKNLKVASKATAVVSQKTILPKMRDSKNKVR